MSSFTANTPTLLHAQKKIADKPGNHQLKRSIPTIKASTSPLENVTSRRKIVTFLSTSLALGQLQGTPPPALAEKWGTRSLLWEHFFQPDLSPEDAVARITQTAEGLHSIRDMLESMAWRYVMFYIRQKQAYLSKDLKNALSTLPPNLREDYVKKANELVDNMDEFDSYVRTPRVYESYLLRWLLQLRPSSEEFEHCLYKDTSAPYRTRDDRDDPGFTLNEVEYSIYIIILCRHPSFLVRSSITISSSLHTEHGMSSKSIEDVKEQEFSDAAAENQVGNDGDQKELDQNSENPMPSPEQEEEIIKKKYGGMLSKKKPLISMDHERAFFDSADWALGKQGAQKPKGPLEALRPKLQPTPQHQMRSRRSAYAPADDDNAEDGSKHAYPEDESFESQGGDDKNSAPEDQTCNRGDDEKSAPDVQTCSA
ncbi:OXYGEN-EVOLVING ENHANCER PROTEIN 3-1 CHLOROPLASTIC [Salix koriyanagi]|uniref:OXYGEN-EVOLVING ENHANCER PROTEIN 3-1 CHLOROPLASTIC n=1 Tax=Salix koriyanagi TaxID=2511006 RepID=A0A9Q0WSR2_9ROSI|nr:OXYGEN-EVOLVING ENHANCER PROTEIN 3-1 CHLOROPLASTIC [Salix koriyanagi]